MKFIFTIFAICGVLIAATGCIAIQKVGSGRQWDDNLLFLIEKGKTTANDIAYSFGPPQKEISGSTGRIWVYYNNTYSYLTQDGYVYGLGESEVSSLTIWYGSDGVVKDINLSYNHYLNPAVNAIESAKNQPSPSTDTNP